MTAKATDRRRRVTSIEEPPLARALFANTRWSWIWLIIRLYLGYEWLTFAIDKLRSPLWIGSQAGTVMTEFVNGAVSKSDGGEVQGWYAWFLENLVLPYAAFWGYVVTFGELLVAIALILGFLTGIAAFFGSFMNMNFLLSGSLSINPILLFLALLVILAWRTAGWYGLDRWVLPALGTPWSHGTLFGSGEREGPEAVDEKEHRDAA